MKRPRVTRSRRIHIHQIQSAEGFETLSEADAMVLSESLFQLSSILFQLFQEQQKISNEDSSEQDSGNPKKEYK